MPNTISKCYDGFLLTQEDKKHLLNVYLPTIRYMDHRRLKRQLQGVNKRRTSLNALIFTFYTLVLILIPSFYVENEEKEIKIGISMPSSIESIIRTIFLGILIITCLVILGNAQFSVSLKWAMYTCYIYIFGTIIYTIIHLSKHTLKHSVYLYILYSFGFCQFLVYALVRLVIYFGPKLALKGYWFSYFEYFRVLEKNENSITLCRYNDVSAMFGNNIFCLCLFIYRIFYRLIRKCSKIIRKAFGNPILKKHDPPFSHQIRYKGTTDEKGRPHGIGEWIEDHPFGERLQGYWFHGFPFATYESQEVGSGSIFVSSLVAFTSSNKNNNKINRGISAVEISISGNFFRDFPNTVFVNPIDFQAGIEFSYIKKANSIYSSVLKKKSEATVSLDDFSWCFAMLNWQSHNPFLNDFDDTSIHIRLDKNSGLISVNGYTHKNKYQYVNEIKIIAHKISKNKINFIKNNVENNT